MAERRRRRNKETKPIRGVMPSVQAAINSVHPSRMEHYKKAGLHALESYLRTWLDGKTIQKFKGPDLDKATISQQIRSWMNGGRKYEYNGYWEDQGIELPNSSASKGQTAPSLPKKRRRRRRNTA